MKLRATKASGSFACSKQGAFELLVHMEADPHTESYARFDFGSVLLPSKSRVLSQLPAYLLRHRSGLFVICAEPTHFHRSIRFQACWDELDAILASRGVWLFSASLEYLRREPQWSNALMIARCAQADIAPDDQQRVIAHLADVGHASMAACIKLCASSPDSFDATLRLISAGVLFLRSANDLSLSCQVSLDPPGKAGPSIGWLERPSSLDHGLANSEAASSR